MKLKFSILSGNLKSISILFSHFNYFVDRNDVCRWEGRMEECVVKVVLCMNMDYGLAIRVGKHQGK